MVARNSITGDLIQSKTSKAYHSNHDAIFGSTCEHCRIWEMRDDQAFCKLKDRVVGEPGLTEMVFGKRCVYFNRAS